MPDFIDLVNFAAWFVAQGLDIVFPPTAPLIPGHIFAALSAAVGA